MRKIISIILVMLMIISTLASCNVANASVGKSPILEKGDTAPLTETNGEADTTVTEEKDPVIIKGNDGATPNIGENGNWWIAGVDTGVSAQGPKGPKGDRGDAGADGVPGKDGEDGKITALPTLKFNDKTNHYEVSFDGGKTWVQIENYDPDLEEESNVNVPMNNVTVTPSTEQTNTSAPEADATEPKSEVGVTGTDATKPEDKTESSETEKNDELTPPRDGEVIIINGADGIVPNIGENGNWWIGDTDTGVSAKGEKGDKGSTGPDGANSYVNGKDGKDAEPFRFRVNKMNNTFELSIDGGVTWQPCGTVSNDPTASEILSYPVDNITILSGYINHEGNYVLPTSSTGDRHGAIIDLSVFKEYGYTSIVLEMNASGMPMEYTFISSDLTINQKPTYATGYSKTQMALSQIELEIPEDAVYLYVGYNQLSVITVPGSITFYK